GGAVKWVNGPNWTSWVTLSAGNLPPGATATFADNPLLPGQSTTMTLSTVRPTTGAPYTINVTGVAVKPPPDGPRTSTTTVLVDANAPNAPEIVSPRNGEVNVPRRPTLSWTSPFLPDAEVSGSAPTSSLGRAPFQWELAATKAPGGSSQAPSSFGMAPGGSSPTSGAAPTPFAFGAQSYHVQVARDSAFTNIVADAQVA